MKEKGFTLIELLAVIVILAIIALIAVPIILNIINDSKKSSDMRSIELYGKAVENAIGNYQVKYPHDTDITLEDVQPYIKYKGNEVECSTIINKDGTVYLSDCKVEGKTVEYTYGKIETSTDDPTTPEEPPVTPEETITVYRWSTDSISIGATIDPTEFTTDPTTLEKNFYLKHVIDKDNKVQESYACAILKNKEYCLTSGEYGYAENESGYTGNVLILKGFQDEGLSCYFDEYNSYCYDGSVILDAYSDGSVGAGDGVGYCGVDGDGSSNCES